MRFEQESLDFIKYKTICALPKGYAKEDEKAGFVIKGGVLEKYTGRQVCVVIPYGIKRIARKAFFRCSFMESVVIPKTVTDIGNSAFEGCTSLKTVTIPDSVDKVGNYAFAGCTALKSATLSKKLYAIEEHTFSGCSSLEHIVIPEGVREILCFAFMNCDKLKRLKVPMSIDSIAAMAFNHPLEQVDFGERKFFNGIVDNNIYQFTPECRRKERKGPTEAREPKETMGQEETRKPEEPPVDGKDIHETMTLSFEEAAFGTEKILAYTVGGVAKKIKVTIPVGIDDGQTLRIREKGEAGKHGGKNGDLRIRIKVEPHPIFRRQFSDIYSTEEIEYETAKKGGTVMIHTLDGMMAYTIEPGLIDATQIILSGKGAPYRSRKKARGNHFVTFKVKKKNRGDDIEANLDVPFMEAVTGTQKEIVIDGKKLLVTVPAGIDENQMIKLEGKGKPGIGDGKPGDLFLTVHLLPHEKFKRNGSDVFSTEMIEKEKAKKGSTILIETLDGTVKYAASQPIKSGMRICLKRKGIGKLDAAGIRGDHYVTLQIKE